MAKGFNLTAELNLRGPSNIRQVVSGIRKQLTGINADVNVNINKQTAQNIGQANARLAQINKTLQQTTKNASSASAAFNKLSTSIKSVASAKVPNTVSTSLKNTAAQSAKTTKALRQATNEFQEFGKLGGLAIKRFAAFSVVTGAIYAVNNAISAGIKQFIEYDRQLTRISQVLNVNRASLKGLEQTITSLSTSLGVSSEQLAAVTVTLSQAGITAGETRKALEALAKSALAPTFDNLTDTTEGAIAAMRQFGLQAGELEGALGSINAVAGKFAVEAGDIITAIQRTGGVFASASKGVSQGTDALNEFIAVFTSVRSTTRESAETIATGLRTIFTRIQREDTVDALKEFGVTLTDLEGKFVGPYKAIQLLAQGLGSIDPRDLKFSNIVEELGGFRQIGKVLPLLQQFATAQDALNVAQQGSGSLSTDAAKGQLALAVQIQKVREEFTALIRSIGDTQAFRDLISLGLDLASTLIKVADATKGMLPLVGLLAAFKGAKALTGFAKGFSGVFGGQGRAEGGYIQKFARGGMVPGSGNRDTVQAMLTPGEFVIRKNAVKAIGQDRLHAMNKYAGGGTVKSRYPIQKFADAGYVDDDKPRRGRPVAEAEYVLDAVVGQIAANEGSAVKTGTSFGTTQVTLSKLASIGVEDAIDRIEIFDEKPSKQVRVGGQVNSMLLGEDSKAAFGADDWLDSSLSSIDQSVNAALQSLGLRRKSKSPLVKDKAVRERIEGFTLETFVSGLLGSKAKGGKEAFDFKGNFKTKAGSSLTITGEPPYFLDAKRTLLGRSEIIKKGVDDPDVNVIEKAYGGFIPKFAKGGVVSLPSSKPYVKNLPSTYEKDRNQSISEAVLAEKRLVLNKEDTINASIVRKPIDPLTQLTGANPATRQAYEDIISNPRPSRSQSQQRGLLFEDMLEQSGKIIKAQGKTSRIDAIAGNTLVEIKSTGEQVSTESLLDKVAGAIFRPRSDVDQIASTRASKQAMTKNPDDLSIGKLQVFEDVARLKQTGRKFRRQSQIQQQEEQKRNLGGYIQTFAKGGSVQDTVPALLTPGEFVINKQAAQKIGSQRLEELNQADKIRGYNKGGFVAFANGGRAPSRPGADISSIGISAQDVGFLKELATTIQDLGITSSSSADLLEKGYRATYEAALEAAEADLKRAQAVGANVSSIELHINAMRRQGQAASDVGNALKNATGEQLQGLQSRLGRGQDIRKAATKEGLGGLANLAVSGNVDPQTLTSQTQEYITLAQRDAKTLAEMDKRLIREKTAQLRAQGKSTKEIDRIIKEEINIRRKATDDVARTQGVAGPNERGRRSQGLSQSLAFAIPTITSLIGSAMGEATTARGAGFQAGIQGAGLAFGAGQALTSVVQDFLPDQLKSLGGNIGTAASAVIGLGQALISATNAARQFRIDEQLKMSERAIEDVGRLFDDLEKDVKNIDIRNSIEDKLVEAGNALAKGLEIQNNTAKVFWANAIDVVTSSDQGAAAQRSQILEREGIFGYLQSFEDSYRQRAVQAMVPERAREESRQFQPIADSINRLIEQRAQRGETAGDIIGGANFDQLARSLARADQATNQRIQAIQADTSLTQAEKNARIESIESIYAEGKVREQVATIARQKEIEALQKSTSVYTRSLERMFQNMEQAIAASAAQLAKMNSQIDDTISSLQGQARIGDIVLDAITVLQNPRAFSAAQVGAATNQAANIFGSESGDMSALINLGESIETAVMGAVNSALREDPGATNAKIERQISSAVDDTLANLGLPPELADKMADEVGRALSDISKAGDDKVDYASLSEKLASLSSVVESSKRAREVAIKALEHYNKALNSYTSNLNKIIDIEISSRNYARKAVDLLANSEIELSKALGKTIKVIDIINNREAQIRRQTGGATNPQEVFDNILKLERERQAGQAIVQASAQSGLAGTDEFTQFNNNVKDTSIQLRENIAALKDLASNGDIAAAALQKIQEAQQNNAQKIGFFERVVTSTPEELEGMNRAFVRLQNNMNGQANSMSQSVGAQKAYYEALRSGASQFEAMRAAQGAFAKERGETLGLMKEILPFLGDSEQAGGIKANVLETMFREMGMGVNPMMQQVLDSLRNPEADPAVAAAIQQYQEANVLQAKANTLLGRLDAELANKVAQQNETSFRNALTSVTIDFENAKLSDIANDVNSILNIMQDDQNNQNDGAENLARGGVVYAQGGQQIFKPKGTDTVPAMLTPGEFVVNKRATQANLPLLKSINSGYYADGGLVTSWNRYDPTINRNSTKEYLDIPDDIENKLLDPKLYHKIPAIAFTAASRHIWPNDPKNYSMDELKDSGSVYFGYVPALQLGRSGYDPDGSRRNTVIDVPDLAKQESFIGMGSDEMALNSLDTGNLFLSPIKTKPINERNLQDYRNKLNILKTHTILDPDVLKQLAADTIDPDSTRSMTATKSQSSYNANLDFDKSWFGLSTKQPDMNSSRDHQNMPGYKRYSENGIPGKSIENGGMALSTEKSISFNDALRRNKKYQIIKNGAQQYSATALDGVVDNNLKLESMYKDHADAYRIYNEALNLLNNNPEFEDISRSPILTKLSNLYNGTKSFESFSASELSEMASYSTSDVPDLSSITVVGQGLRNALLAKAREAIQLEQTGQDIQALYGDASLPNSRYTLNKPFDISDELLNNEKQFAWTNLSPKDLGEAFRQAQEQEQRERQFKEGPNERKILPLTKNKVEIPAILTDGTEIGIPFEYDSQYWDYKGKYYNFADSGFTGDAFQKFIPKQVSDPFNVFKNIDENAASILGFDEIPEAKLPFELNDALKKQIGQVYESLMSNLDPNDDQLKNKLLSQTVPMGPMLLKALGIGQAMPAFVKSLDQTQDVNIGELLLANVMKHAMSEGQKSMAIDDPQELKGAQLEDSQLAAITRRLAGGSIEIFREQGFARRFGRLWGPLLSNVKRNRNIDEPEEAKAVAGVISNRFNQLGGYADYALNNANNAKSADIIKDALVLSSGAWQTFGGINQGNTQLLSDFVRAGGEDLPTGYIEGLYRSLGGGMMMQKVKAMKLPPEYTGDSLKGGKIARIGPDGSIVYEPMDEATPKTVGQLIDLIFNPYNEFANFKARTGLIGKFQADLNNLKSPNGRVGYFDPKTMAWVNQGVDILEQWYGGIGNLPNVDLNDPAALANIAGAGVWPGQDFLFDQAIGNIQQRAQILLAAFQTPQVQALYKAADEVNAAFGLKNKFGPLPGAQWFQSRAVRGALMPTEEPQNRARGGIIYAQSGGRMVNFQPKGTDTVPAMLTPGEFVINRKATQENLPLLKAINNGEKGYSRGGVVYAEDGGRVGPPTFKGQSGYFTSNDGKKIFGKLVSVSDKEAVINYAGRDWTVPLTRFDDATRNAIASGSGGGGRGAQTFLDQMTTEGALGLSGRPTGGMLKVPTFARDMATGTFTDNTGRNKTYGEIVEVGSDGIMLKNRTGVGFVPYNKLDAKSRSLAYELYTSAQRTQTRDFDSRINRLYPGGLYPHMRIGLKPEMTDREIRAKVDENERNRTTRRVDVRAYDDIPAGTRPSDPNLVSMPLGVGGLMFFDEGYPAEDKRVYAAPRTTPGKEKMKQEQAAQDKEERIAADRRYLEKARARGADSRTGAERRERATSAAQERAQKRFNTIKERRGEEAAREAMVRDGYTQVDGQWTRTPRERGEGAADFEQKMANRYWQQYNASGTDLDPVTWVERNLPGLPNRPKTYEAFLANAGMTPQQAQSRRVGTETYTTVGGDVIERVTQTTGLGEQPGTYQEFDKERLLQSIMQQEGVTRWQAGNLYEQRQAKAVGEWKQKLADKMANFRTALDQEIQSRMQEIRQLASPTGRPVGQDPMQGSESASGVASIMTLKESILNSLAQQGIVTGSGGAASVDVRDMGLSYLPRDIYQQVLQQSTVGAITERALQNAWNSQVGASSVEAAGTLPGRLEEAAAQQSAAFEREIQARIRVIEQRQAVLDSTDALYAELEKQRIELWEALGRVDPYSALKRGAPRPGYRSRGGMVYANQGMLVPYEPRGTDTVPAMLTPGEFVVNREATQQNLPLLRAINRSRGGSVSYLAEGTDKETEYEKRMRLRREAYEKEMKRRREAMATSREQGVSYQQAYYQQQQQQQQAAGGIQQISQPQQNATRQAAQAAFDPRNSGDVNRQLTIFGQLLTGTNQVLTQFGAIVQQLTQVAGAAAGGVTQAAPANGVNISGIEQFTQQFGQFVEQLAAINLPPIIRVEGQVTANVNFAGAEALRSLADTTIRQVVEDTVNAEFNKRNRDNEGQD